MRIDGGDAVRAAGDEVAMTDDEVAAACIRVFLARGHACVCVAVWGVDGAAPKTWIDGALPAQGGGA